MPDSNTNLKSKIMRRVFNLWFTRSIAPLFLIEFIGGIIAVYFVANFVFVSRVVDNALSAALGNPLKLFAYFWGAFLVTTTEVKVLIVILFIAFGMLLKDLNRSMLSYLLMRRNER